MSSQTLPAVGSRTMLSSATKERARVMAVRIGERLHGRILDVPAGRGLAGGAGYALAFHSLWNATRDGKFLRAAHSCLRQAAHCDDVPSIGLFTGLSGLRAVAAILSTEMPQCRRLVEQCDAFIDARLPSPGCASISSIDDFDVIGGWSGARLARFVAGPGEADRLVELLRWVMADEARWRCVHPVRTNDPPENDLSVAHGIAGVIGTVALTTTPLDEPLRILLHDQTLALIARAIEVGNRVAWPGAIQATRTVTQHAWCYGTPGTAAMLYWAGTHLALPSVIRFAVDALTAEMTPGAGLVQFRDNAICHGSLGCALVYASVGAASGRAGLRRCVEPMVSRTLDCLEKDRAACWGLGPDLKRRDLLSELDGAAGVALALLTLCGDYASGWLRLHALEPW